MKKLNKNNKGFSLVELLVVIAIMVVLVGVLAPTLLGNIEKTREAKDIQAVDTLAGNVQAAMTDEKFMMLLLELPEQVTMYILIYMMDIMELLLLHRMVRLIQD